ncbi:DnaB-like helicase N-terminal domain-containing protein, partial [Thermophilibacter provencensis]
MAQSEYDVNPTRMRANQDAVMPQDPEAEASVLSAMMVSSEALQECLIELDPDDFYFPSNRTVFTAMREMFDKNMPIDTISLADYLKSSGELERVGGRSFLLGLGNNSLALV